MERLQHTYVEALHAYVSINHPHVSLPGAFSFCSSGPFSLKLLPTPSMGSSLPVSEPPCCSHLLNGEQQLDFSLSFLFFRTD